MLLCRWVSDGASPGLERQRYGVLMITSLRVDVDSMFMTRLSTRGYGNFRLVRIWRYTGVKRRNTTALGFTTGVGTQEILSSMTDSSQVWGMIWLQ